MRSPSRPPLKSRNGHDLLLQDPAYVARKEKERRRLIRLQQVRLRSAEAARAVRQRVRREQIRQIEKIAKDELQKYIKQKTDELIRLEAEYQNALRDIGLGHEGVKEHLEFEKWKAEQAKLDRQVAEVRGEHATRVVQHQRTLKTKIIDEKANLKKCVKMTEDTRAAEIRARKKKISIDPSSTGKVIEIDPYADEEETKRVRFANDKSRSDPNVLVRNLGKENISKKPGVQAAIREEQNRRQLSLEQKKAARLRGQAALKRAKMVRPTITESYFNDTDDHESSEFLEGETEEFAQTVNAKIKQIPRPTSLRADVDEVDLVPSRGPSASSTLIESDSSSLHATVCRPVAGFDLHEINLHGATSSKEFFGHIHGQASGFKNSNVSAQVRPSNEAGNKNKQDQDFIAKVLEGFELSNNEEELHVDIQVEEKSSTFLSSQVLSSSSSSSDITRERFLSKDWQTQDIHQLIGTLKSDRKKDNKKQQSELRDYIEKLLRMKREEIVNLSITESSADVSSQTSSSQSIGSILSSHNHSSGFSSSTPSSILVSSSEGSKNSLSKSVRFQDQDALDSSYKPSKEKMSKEEEDKRKEIIERTRLSLVKVHAYYEEQRKRLEAQLEARQKQKLDQEHSEGPLSTSSTSSTGTNSDKPSNSSAKETNDDFNENAIAGPSKKSVVRRSHHTLSRQMVSRMNKSSSSGTTTSGSIATEELLTKLKQLEMPKLARPPRTREHMVSDDLNTSADLMKATDLEDSPELKMPSSFHFTSEGEDQDKTLEKAISRITLSSSD